MTHPALIERITRSLAYMLRHQPERFDLELDELGYGHLDEVVQALNEALGESVDEDDVEEAISSGDRPRYELVDDRIRALYGHSIRVEPGDPSKPQDVLYLGIGSRDAERALEYGLRGGRRRFLHLALTEEEGRESGRRTGPEYAVLSINAVDAWEDGINFYDRKSLFLAEEIPTQFLELVGHHSDGYERLLDEGRDRDRGRGGRGQRGPGRRSEGGGRGRREDSSNQDSGGGGRRSRGRRGSRAPSSGGFGAEVSASAERAGSERPERQEPSERPERPERSERPERQERSERPARGNQGRERSRDRGPAREERPRREREEPREAPESRSVPRPEPSRPGTAFGLGLDGESERSQPEGGERRERSRGERGGQDAERRDGGRRGAAREERREPAKPAKPAPREEAEPKRPQAEPAGGGTKEDSFGAGL